jgi:hypothetical protein
MGLSWVRLDANIGSHDKILALLTDPSAKKWQAFASYTTALAWSGGQGTDGFIPQTALSFVHGNTSTARLLVKYRLWEEGLTGWQIVNFAERQELALVTASKAEAKRMAGEKGNCSRWHGPSCWVKGKGCSRAGL